MLQVLAEAYAKSGDTRLSNWRREHRHPCVSLLHLTIPLLTRCESLLAAAMNAMAFVTRKAGFPLTKYSSANVTTFCCDLTIERHQT